MSLPLHLVQVQEITKKGIQSCTVDRWKTSRVSSRSHHTSQLYHQNCKLVSTIQGNKLRLKTRSYIRMQMMNWVRNHPPINHFKLKTLILTVIRTWQKVKINPCKLKKDLTWIKESRKTFRRRLWRIRSTLRNLSHELLSSLMRKTNLKTHKRKK